MAATDSSTLTHAMQIPPIQGLKTQIGAFSIVGVANTLLDFAVLNIGIFILDLPILPVNIISTTILLRSH